MRDFYEVQREREQPAGPVNVIITAPNPGAARKAAEQVRTLFQAGRQVVRLYPDSREMPEEVPPCDMIIVVHQRPPEGDAP